MAKSRTKTTTNVGEDVGKKEPLHYWWECKWVQPLWKAVWRLLKKLTIEPPYDHQSHSYAYIWRNISKDTIKTFAHPCLLQYFA
jgi:hypothetical protein